MSCIKSPQSTRTLNRQIGISYLLENNWTYPLPYINILETKQYFTSNSLKETLLQQLKALGLLQAFGKAVDLALFYDIALMHICTYLFSKTYSLLERNAVESISSFLVSNEICLNKNLVLRIHNVTWNVKSISY